VTKDKVKKCWRILIDAFRTELELIYRNKKLEDVYCSFGKRAFAKCVKFKKTLEFKRLSEVVKSHQSHNIKTVEKQSATSPAFALDIKNAETNERLCEFRFQQLEYAKELGLWLDSFNIIVDINTLMKSKKTVTVRTLIPYYDNLHQIFWNAKEFLYHAVSYQSYYTCLKNSGKDAETIRDASSILV
jgi:translation initiation factor 3 subunit A